MEDFARQVANNNQKEYLKSAPIPIHNDNRLVKIILGDTFHEIVNDEDKDVRHFHVTDCHTFFFLKYILLINLFN